MNESMFSKIDCVRIPVSTLQEGLKFYFEKLGCEIIWRTETAVGLRLKDDMSEIVLHTEDIDIEIDFKVEDVLSAIKLFEKSGGSVITGPFDISIGKCAVVKDPWDNQYILLDSSKGILQTDNEKNVIGMKQI